MFQGAAQLSLDAKGRLTVPTRHRDGLLTPAAGKLVLTGHPHYCLLMHPEPAWPPIRDELLRVGAFDPQTARWKRLMIGFAEETEVDGSGRILISPELRKFAGIDRQVMMVGQGTHFEVWSVDRWEAEMAKLAEGDGKPPPGLENFAL